MRRTTLVALLTALNLTAFAQRQLPDSGFEDWSGEVFKHEDQPKWWHYSNVVQFGFKFNFAHQVAGRNGGKAVEVANTAMKVMGINGGTSPGYIALGQPWTFIPSLNKIPYATAGTYGGIAWSSRPDSVELWIKRTGPKWQEENFNIVFYMWAGTAYGTSYHSEAGCSDIPEEFAGVSGGGLVDEESDIRMRQNPNVCGHRVDAEEIGEAWLCERAEYKEWTKICIPVYYLNDLQPEKCNLILSAGNYPAGKSKKGINAGNSLTVDDVRLIYAATIDRIAIDGKVFESFDPKSEEVQVCPWLKPNSKIEAWRGTGQHRSVTGSIVEYPGRHITEQEMNITRTEITTITVRSEEGKTKTYRLRAN